MTIKYMKLKIDRVRKSGFKIQKISNNSDSSHVLKVGMKVAICKIAILFQVLIFESVDIFNEREGRGLSFYIYKGRFRIDRYFMKIFEQ